MRGSTKQEETAPLELRLAFVDGNHYDLVVSSDPAEGALGDEGADEDESIYNAWVAACAAREKRDAALARAVALGAEGDEPPVSHLQGSGSWASDVEEEEAAGEWTTVSHRRRRGGGSEPTGDGGEESESDEPSAAVRRPQKVAGSDPPDAARASLAGSDTVPPTSRTSSSFRSRTEDAQADTGMGPPLATVSSPSAGRFDSHLRGEKGPLTNTTEPAPQPAAPATAVPDQRRAPPATGPGTAPPSSWIPSSRRVPTATLPASLRRPHSHAVDIIDTINKAALAPRATPSPRPLPLPPVGPLPNDDDNFAVLGYVCKGCGIVVLWSKFGRGVGKDPCRVCSRPAPRRLVLRWYPRWTCPCGRGGNSPSKLVCPACLNPAPAHIESRCRNPIEARGAVIAD